MEAGYIMSFILCCLVSGFIVGFCTVYFCFARKWNTSARFSLSIVTGLMLGFLFPFAIAFLVHLADDLAESKIKSVAIDEVNYFKDAIAGKRSESEIRSYYTEKQLSSRGIEAICHELALPTTEINFKLLPVFLSVFEKHPVLLGHLVDRPEVPLDIKLKVADNPKSRAVLAMAENTHTPPPVLLKLASYDQKEEMVGYVIGLSVCKNKNAPRKAKQICAIRYYPERDGFSNLFESKTEEIALWQFLAKDSRENIRLSVAKHPKAPPNILSKLADDTSKKVAQAAIKNLQKSGVTHGP